MDISAALESCSKTIESLRGFPKRSRMPRDGVLYVSKARANEARWLEIRKCMPFLQKIIEEVKDHIARFDSGYFESIENRKSFIGKRLDESNKENQHLADKTRLVNEIGRYEKMGLVQFENIEFTKRESLEIIKRLHDPGVTFENQHLEHILRKHILLDFDFVDPEETETYRKIIAMVENGLN